MNILYDKDWAIVIVMKRSSNGVFLAIWGATERLEVVEGGVGLGFAKGGCQVEQGGETSHPLLQIVVKQLYNSLVVPPYVSLYAFLLFKEPPSYRHHVPAFHRCCRVLRPPVSMGLVLVLLTVRLAGCPVQALYIFPVALVRFWQRLYFAVLYIRGVPFHEIPHT